MNIMRKIRGGGTVPPPSEEDHQNSQHTALGLMHLKKLFSEYTHPPHPLSEREKDDKLYNMLPLFCKVFGNSPSTDMVEKFRDLLAFCQQVSLLMVSEIRHRASNQSTEAASCAIVKFLEIENSEESSNGWMLLTTLNLLAAGDKSLVQVMTSASVPSTLVKCLYLFFDLPEIENEDTPESGSDFTPRERRILLQKIFVQVLVRLCGHTAPAEELARKDDLNLLFSAITSWCPPHNVLWRKSAAEVLMTLSRHGLSQPVVSYIHSKGCVALCIKNMQRVQELSPLEIVEMFVTVFCFLKDSSEVSQTLLEDFRLCQGYLFLSEFLLRLEQDSSAEAQEAIRNLVLIVASLTMCGYIELKPSQASLALFFNIFSQLSVFITFTGASVRNIQAFQVLQSVFLKANSASLCSTILDAISSVYHSDDANYFILEGQHTLSQFAERIHMKPPEIQEKFFQLLEFIIFHLHFVPCKELISLSILLKGQASISCSIICMQTLLNILKHNAIFKDVYREVGILEVFVTCLHKYATLLKEKQQAQEEGKVASLTMCGYIELKPSQASLGSIFHMIDFYLPQPSGCEYSIPEESEKLGSLVMEALTALLAGNASNAGVFRECGGARCAHNLVPYSECRSQALGIVRELVLSPGGDDDMGTLLGMMHSAPATALELKTHILKSLLICLRESHRTRTVFRKVGGFVYVMSVLVSMEGCLDGGTRMENNKSPDPGAVSNPLSYSSNTSLSPTPWETVPTKKIIALLHTVFSTVTVAMRFEPANAKFFHHEICFTSLCDTIRLLGCFSNQQYLEEMVDVITGKDESTFLSLFTGNVLEAQIPEHIHPQLSYACLVMRLLYDVALDAYDKPNMTTVISLKSPSHRHQQVEVQKSVDSPGGKRAAVNCLNLTPPVPDPIIVHPGVVVAMLHLIPSIQNPEQRQQAMTLQVCAAEVLKSLVRTERNQQVMCEAGLPWELLCVGHVALEDETHPLHSPLQYMLERLAAQTLEPRDLREFLRLGNPLCSLSLEEPETSLPCIPHRPNMTLPPNRHNHSCMGGGAPVPLTRVKTLVSMTTPRDFRLLHGGASTGAILPPFVEFDMSSEGFGCLYLPSLAPQSLSAASASSGGGGLGTGGMGAGGSGMVGGVGSVGSGGAGGGGGDVNVIGGIGSGNCRHCYILVIQSQARDRIFPPQTGLSYSTWVCVDKYSDPRTDPHCVRLLTVARHMPAGGGGGFGGGGSSRRDDQNQPGHHLACLAFLLSARSEPISPLVPEEKVIFGLNAKAVSQLTLAKIRKVYSRADNKSIAKQLGMSSHENATPIRVLHNSAGHLSGPARSLGGVVIGYLGVRVFSPRPVAKVVENIGGCSVLLGLIAMAQDVESLYAAVKALVCVVRSNRCAQREMERQCGHQTLAMLLRRKKSLLNSHILHLTFALVGTVNSGQESASIPNVIAFRDLLCDLEVWHEAPGELERSLFEHLLELVAESNEKNTNLKIARELQLLQRLLRILPRVSSPPTRNVLLSLLRALLGSHPRSADLLALLHYISQNPGGGAANLTVASSVYGYIGTPPAWRRFSRLSWKQGPCHLVEEVLSSQTVALLYQLGPHYMGSLQSPELNGAAEWEPDVMGDAGARVWCPDLLQEGQWHHLVLVLNRAVLKNSSFSLYVDGQHVHTQKFLTLHVLGQFVAATLPPFALNEKQLILHEGVDMNKQVEVFGSGESERDLSFPGGLGDHGMVNRGGDQVSSILLRNRCLQLLHSLLFLGKKVNVGFCDEVSKVLGFDWVLLFLQGHLHPTTVVWGLRVLVALCSVPPLLQKFREATGNGGWLRDTDTSGLGGGLREVITRLSTPAFNGPLGIGMGSATNAVSGVVSSGVGGGLTPSIMSAPATSHREVKMEAFQIPGFQTLGWLLPQHIDIPEVYFLLMALMMGQPVKLLPADSKLDLDTVWNFMFGVPASQSVTSIAGRVTLCPEAVIVILGMVRTMLNQEGKSPDSLPEWLRDYPVTIIQFLFFLYHNMADFMPVFMSGDVLGALASTLFPLPRSSGSAGSSEASSPMEEEIKTCAGSESAIIVRSPSKDIGLTNHPAKKFVMDFLRVIVVDSLSLPTSGKGPPAIDLVLDASPENSSGPQQAKFQTDVLGALMEHLLAADVLIGEQAALPVVPGGNLQHIAPNVFYLAGRIVDKLWQGTFSKDPHEVFDFVVKLISQAKRRPATMATFSLEGIYHCLNRTILFLLSRPTHSIAEQMSVLEALHKLTNHRGLIFGPGNHELEFIGCLTYCLLQLTSEMKVATEYNIKTTWYVNPNVESCEDKLNAQQGQNLMAVAAKRVWDEMYIFKKTSIEEVFKISLNPGSNKGPPELESIRDQVYENANRLWVNYVEMERKASYRIPWELQNQIQSVRPDFTLLIFKIQKVTGGLTRLASRTKVKKEASVVSDPTKRCGITGISSANLKVEAASWTLAHVALVRELAESQLRHHARVTQHEQKFVLDEWLNTEAELTRERGLWGPVVGSRLDKWMLDMTEGPCRMRKKLMRNDLFYIHYPFRPELEYGSNRALKYKVATSYDSKEYYQKYRPHTLFERSERGDVIIPDSLPSPQASIDDHQSFSDSHVMEIGEDFREIGFQGLRSALGRPGVNRSVSEPDDDGGEGIEEPIEGSETDTDEDSLDKQTLYRLLEQKEKISHVFRCARIQGLDTVEGLLLFGKEHFYVVDGLTFLKSRDGIEASEGGGVVGSAMAIGSSIGSMGLPSYGTSHNATNAIHDPILPSPGGGHTNPQPSRTRQCSKFAYEDIREVHKRRYLLQPIALEVFSGDGRNYLLAFPRKIRNKVYQRFMGLATSIADSAQQSVAGQKRTAHVEQGAGLLSSLIGETSVTQRWVRGEISNFQYLMHLNTLAGRSYNDLMQYPVFPWILADYDSEEVDLTDPASFRDFTKPMGAQSPERLEQFKKRYKEWDDPHGETPPYHYGTHYSSAMIVCSYLVRMEPFTQHFLRLQGGHFDLADRMFHSIREAWYSASKHNMSDVKELIPEFFYLPEFLVNSNNFDLGCKQSGVQLGDVVLPPWAKGDPGEFIRAHRLALECDYVSQNLHHWIDLVFGCKQTGPAAAAAVNVFHHLFYEGNVDIYNIDDPLKKTATIGFINNFGQIPKQLFKKPHPAKKISHRTSVIDPGPITPGLSFASGDRLFFHNLDNLKPSMQPIKELKGPVGQILHCDKGTLLAVEQNKVLIPPTYNKYVAWGFADHSLRIGNYESDRAMLVCEGAGLHHTGEILTCVCPSSKLIVTAGTSTVVTVWEYGKKQLSIKKSLYGHIDAVTCLAASPAYNVVVSGSRDATAIVWDLSRLIFVRQLRGHAAPIAAVAVNELTTHEWDSQNVIMTGSTDGVARMWSVDFVQVPNDEKPMKAVSESVIPEPAQDSKDEQEVVDTKEESGKENVEEGEASAENQSAVPDEEKGETAIPEKEGTNEMERSLSKGSDEEEEKRQRAKRVKELVKQMSMSGEYSTDAGGMLVKSGSESSLSEDEEGEEEGVREGSCSTKEEEAKEDSGKDKEGEEKKEEAKSPTEPKEKFPEEPKGRNLVVNEAAQPVRRAESLEQDPPVVLRRRKSSTHNPAFRKSEGCQLSERVDIVSGNMVSIEVSSSQKPESESVEDGGVESLKSADSILAMRTSKSDTSLTDSFVVIGESGAIESGLGVHDSCRRETPPSNLAVTGSSGNGGTPTAPPRRKRNPQNILREGFKWQRQLVFRSKLTMHTAYDRKDNAEPASITALAVSKDHRVVYVGDTRGRVFSWSVSEQPGRAITDHWLKDEGAEACAACNVRFSLYERRHHCRNCGQVFCSKCSRFESEIFRLRILKPVRVCQRCYATLRGSHGNSYQTT
ncbi:hypothetical protein J437_LFUL010268 [Ladona fulva]|uniref:WD repeat and FYVE domain-containing protein 3 n=1 Tax=Ladona fulva TaxID=123851 RepID=A0A8K0K8U3_LADFU|nr:hypothetical protein J437_LFUL010268 [Ladona fulva]